MNCENVSAILDDHAEQRLTAAERCALDAHLAICAECARAWQAYQALATEVLPATPADLLARVLRSTAARPASQSHRSPVRFVIGTAVFALGAAVAGITIFNEPWGDADIAATNVGDPDSPSASNTGAATEADPEERNAETAGAHTDDPFVFPDGDYFILLREPPEYPTDALEEGAEATVRMQYTIAKDGTVKDARVVTSTDPRFEAPALVAIERWKYMPRVVGGKRVDVPDIMTSIRFVFALRPETPPTEREGPPLAELLEPAWQCAAEHDWLCAEQVLDEVSAAYELAPSERQKVRAFYGYLYTQYEDYERAIAAYRQAIEIGGKRSSERMTLAHLYFTRQQYQLALDTALEYVGDNAAAFPSTYPFIEKLRQLGITPTDSDASKPTTAVMSTIDRLGAAVIADSDYVPLVRITPSYPADAIAQNLSGSVRLEFTITETGQVADVQVLNSSNPVFEAPAIEALQRWRYAPSVVNGSPVERTGVMTTMGFYIKP
jgi:TonB family protein